MGSRCPSIAGRRRRSFRRARDAGNAKRVGWQKLLSLHYALWQSDGMANETKCPVCKSKASVEGFVTSAEVSCVRCGKYSFSGLTSDPLQKLKPQQIPKISGWVRENQGVMIREADLSKLYELRMPSVGEKAEKILLYLEKKFPNPGTRIPGGQYNSLADEALAYELLAVGWACDFGELDFLMKALLWKENGLIEYIEEPEDAGLEVYWQITPMGWSHLDSLRRGNPQSVIGFVAMSFDPSMDSASAAIEQGIRAAGYSALRIDREQHNNKIDDEIIASIRRSKFLVADFTGHKGGVYFETGFAKGLGLEVFWLCREDDFELHFDTRQYPHIKWQETKLPELTKALKDRIEATFGHGPVSEDQPN